MFAKQRGPGLLSYQLIALQPYRDLALKVNCRHCLDPHIRLANQTFFSCIVVGRNRASDEEVNGLVDEPESIVKLNCTFDIIIMMVIRLNMNFCNMM